MFSPIVYEKRLVQNKHQQRRQAMISNRTICGYCDMHLYECSLDPIQSDQYEFVYQQMRIAGWPCSLPVEMCFTVSRRSFGRGQTNWVKLMLFMFCLPFTYSCWCHNNSIFFICSNSCWCNFSRWSACTANNVPATPTLSRPFEPLWLRILIHGTRLSVSFCLARPSRYYG